MRTVAKAILVVSIGLRLSAQNTDIQSLQGVQFNFGNPGARALGMGGAFLGSADDASAAEANPAGLTILRKTEVSVEVRRSREQQILPTSGTFPDIQRTEFPGKVGSVSFASVVVPIGERLTVGAYYHEPLRDKASGALLPTRDPFTGELLTDVPRFYIPAGGTSPVSQERCQEIFQTTNDPTSCLEYTLLPFTTAVQLREVTLGLAAGWKLGRVSIGGSARYHRFNESAINTTYSQDFFVQTQDVQTTGRVSGTKVEPGSVHDVTFSAGLKWTPIDPLSVGMVYKQGPTFAAPRYFLDRQSGFEFEKVADVRFHVPDVFGIGLSYRPEETLTINADAVRVKYSNLTDQFFSFSGLPSDAFRANDVTELHAGAELFPPLNLKVPVAIRIGWWHDPAHSIEWTGTPTPDSAAEAFFASIYFPRNEAQNHVSIGAGVSWPRFQLDAAYDKSQYRSVGSISAIMRF